MSMLQTSASCWSQEDGRPRAAFVGGAGNITQAVILRMLAPVLPRAGGQVLDLGGGEGRLAEALAPLGLTVTIVDSDPTMLERARKHLGHWIKQGLVILVESDAADASRILGNASYDLVSCHSVLMYVQRPGPVLQAAVQACRPGGNLSITSLNPEASAMRAGLQGRWGAALNMLVGGTDPGSYITFDHPRQQIEEALRDLGCTIAAHFGVGIFCDHYQTPLDLEPGQFAQVVALETLAGSNSPYREVARCFHLIARRSKMPGTG